MTEQLSLSLVDPNQRSSNLKVAWSHLIEARHGLQFSYETFAALSKVLQRGTITGWKTVDNLSFSCLKLNSLSSSKRCLFTDILSWLPSVNSNLILLHQPKRRWCHLDSVCFPHTHVLGLSASPGDSTRAQSTHIHSPPPSSKNFLKMARFPPQPLQSQFSTCCLESSFYNERQVIPFLNSHSSQVACSTHGQSWSLQWSIMTPMKCSPHHLAELPTLSTLIDLRSFCPLPTVHNVLAQLTGQFTPPSLSSFAQMALSLRVLYKIELPNIKLKSHPCSLLFKPLVFCSISFLLHHILICFVLFKGLQRPRRWWTLIS